jgi:uncharacterized protein
MDRPARTLLAIAFGFSWSVALLLYLSGGIDSGIRHGLGGFAFMCGPALGALAAWRIHRLDRTCFALQTGSRSWLLRSWLVACLLVAMAYALSYFAPSVQLTTPAAALADQLRHHVSTKQSASLERLPPSVLSILLVAQAAIVGPLVNAPLMLSEELGWRGVLWSRWQTLPFWRHAGLTGFVWGLWHAPLIAMGHNYPGTPIVGIGMMGVFCMLLTPALHHLRERGGSVWHACIFHGTINATATLGALCTMGGTPLTRGIAGVPGLVVLALVVAVVAWRRRVQAGP